MAAEVAAQPYKRPPITEAVVGVQFGARITEDDLKKVSGRFKELYPVEQHVKTFGIQIINPPDGGRPDVRVEETPGYRRTSDDATEIILFSPESILFSQLSPYPGWELFFARFERDWELCKREIGYRKINRLGVRYINRIDIPNPDTSSVIRQSDYMNVYIRLPEILGPTLTYNAQAILQIEEIRAQLIINTSLAPSPLLNHTSFLVDIDVGRTEEVPQRDADIFTLLAQIRDKKNMVFESCITDRARELFSR